MTDLDQTADKPSLSSIHSLNRLHALPNPEDHKVSDEQSIFGDTSEKHVHTESVQTMDEPANVHQDVAVDKDQSHLVKQILIGVAALIVTVYLAGFAFFTFNFYPNTTLGGQDISLKSVGASSEILGVAAQNYVLNVTGQGLSFEVPKDQIDLTIDAKRVSDAAHQDVHAWKWPFEVFSSHDVSSHLAVTYDAEKLKAIVDEHVAAVNETAVAPIDASVVYETGASTFIVSPEVGGSVLDGVLVLGAIEDDISSLQSNTAVTEEQLVKPGVTQEDETLIQARDEANRISQAKITIALDGEPAYEVNSDVIQSFIAISPDQVVSLDQEKLASWATGMEDSLNTVGSERTYTRPDGKVITVSGGTFGWKADTSDLSGQITDAIVAGEQNIVIDVPVNQRADAYNPETGIDFGRYIDVDITEQHARFYDEAGNIIWESDIVTGRPSMKTPTGVWKVNPKLSPVTLVGRILPSTGEPEYRTKVAFWVPFVGGSIGFHDATWQSRFGGTRYTSGYGSHGCVNLPYDKAEELYDLAEEGDCVIVHM